MLLDGVSGAIAEPFQDGPASGMERRAARGPGGAWRHFVAAPPGREWSANGEDYAGQHADYRFP